MVAKSAAKKIRILVGKVGLDGHDRGAKVVARALRDAGMEVIYTGIRQTPEKIVAATIAEDVDAIGLSILSAAHIPLCSEVLNLLRAQGAHDIPLIVGGIIPKTDVPILKEMGVKGVFGPGTPLQEITSFIQANARQPN